MMSLRGAAAALAGICVLSTSCPANAGAIRDALPTLFGENGITVGGPNPQAFQQSSVLELSTLGASLRGQFGDLPLTSAVSSYTFEFDPSLGTFTRTTESFGPIASQRAETLGRNKFSFGLTYSRVEFSRLDGKDLDDGELRLTFVDPGTGNTITGQVFLDIKVDVLGFSATYGVTDELDLSILTTLFHSDVTVRGVARSDQPGVVFADGSDTLVARSSEESTGLGDLVIRGKWNFLRAERFGLALGADLRLPTGSEKQVRTLDTVRVSPFFVASAKAIYGVSPHVNFGFHIGDTDKVENEFFYNVGFDWAVVKPVTLAFDLLGRHVLNNKRPEPNQAPGAFLTNTLRIAGDDILTASVGVKVNPWKDVLLLGNVLIPLNSTGLRADVIPTIGVEISF
jgi:hypothetical protein